MKIWIDLINSPQVSFFEPFVNEFIKNGHQIILTCRDSSNTVNLLKQRNWEHTVIGDKAKKHTIQKILSFPGRIFSLYSFLKNKKIDIAISQSSFYLPITAKLLGIPSIFTNDNEHAIGNIPSFLFATKVLIPESMPISKAIRSGAKKSKIINYPGIKEGVYLWPKGVDIQNKRKEIDSKIKKIYVRPEPTTAQYYSGKLNFLDNLLIELKEIYSVVILCREKTQLEHYKEKKFSGIEVPSNTLSFEEIASNCSLFIGAGGSMTREMALIGVPTVSVYQGELLKVDKFLLSQNLMIHRLELTFKEVQDIINGNDSNSLNSSLINKGKEAYNIFKQELLKYNI